MGQCATASLISGDGAVIFRHACWMDLEGIVSKRIGLRERPDNGMLKAKNPRFSAARTANLTLGPNI